MSGTTDQPKRRRPPDRSLNKLSAAGVVKMVKLGLHSDGGGLYLQITPRKIVPSGENRESGRRPAPAELVAKSWVFRYKVDGKARDMGLGPLQTVSLAEARAMAETCRRQRQSGTDPLEERNAARDRAKANAAEAAAEAARAMTFQQCAEAYIGAHKAGWKNPKHAQQWTNTLTTYAYPIFGGLPVKTIDVGLVMKVVEPIWTEKTETASRVRGRIEAVLDWATVRNYRQGDNPARWKGHLDALLPAKTTVRQVKHHPALPFGQVGEFMVELRQQPGVSARALEFTILTVARSNEVLGGLWREIDPANLWTAPAERMKGRAGQRREHRKPLAPRAIEILDEMRKLAPMKHGRPDPDAPIFPGAKAGKGLSNMAMEMVLRRMDPHSDKAPAKWLDPKTSDPITVHGFRSTFRDWAAERTSFANEVCEMALAHVVDDKVEAAYRRGDLFKKRQQLAEAWAKFCDTVATTADNVTPIRGGVVA